MLHHLWYEPGDLDAEALKRRAWTNTLTRQPVPRRGGARRVVGRALMGLGELIAAESRAGGPAGR
jgi:hypothetical protein